jgi:ubiquinone/menaquinone biosynthesis C-methylase UbiE
MNTLNRFSNRVDNYIKYRPGYPPEIIQFLEQEGLLTKEKLIADIGSGTGISALPFLKNENLVYGIEPNKEMRLAAEKLLSEYKNFKSIDATAENTTLADDSIDVIIAGQAFHWFDKAKAKIEFKRILKSSGAVALIWNDRRTDSTPFLRQYEDFIIRFATDYSEVNHKNIDDKIFDIFFGERDYRLKVMDNFQHFDFEGLKGRILSSSYMPDENHKDYNSMLDALHALFNSFQNNGKVTLEYDTKIYFGKLN